MLFGRLLKAFFDVVAFFVGLGVVASVIAVLVMVVKSSFGW